jgi:hypothetical protein
LLAVGLGFAFARALERPLAVAVLVALAGLSAARSWAHFLAWHEAPPFALSAFAGVTALVFAVAFALVEWIAERALGPRFAR